MHIWSYCATYFKCPWSNIKLTSSSTILEKFHKNTVFFKSISMWRIKSSNTSSRKQVPAAIISWYHKQYTSTFQRNLWILCCVFLWAHLCLNYVQNLSKYVHVDSFTFSILGYVLHLRYRYFKVEAKQYEIGSQRTNSNRASKLN